MYCTFHNSEGASKRYLNHSCPLRKHAFNPIISSPSINFSRFIKSNYEHYEYNLFRFCFGFGGSCLFPLLIPLMEPHTERRASKSRKLINRREKRVPKHRGRQGGRLPSSFLLSFFSLGFWFVSSSPSFFYSKGRKEGTVKGSCFLFR